MSELWSKTASLLGTSTNTTTSYAGEPIGRTHASYDEIGSRTICTVLSQRWCLENLYACPASSLCHQVVIWLQIQRLWHTCGRRCDYCDRYLLCGTAVSRDGANVSQELSSATHVFCACRSGTVAITVPRAID